MSCAGVHLKHAAPLKLILILGNQVKVKMAAAVPVGPVIHFVGMKYLVNGLCRPGHIGEKGVPVFLADVNQFADVILIGDNSAPGMALLLEQNQRADAQIADINSKGVLQFPSHTIAAVLVFHMDTTSLNNSLDPQNTEKN